jgi:hypothetical protein
MLAVILLLCAGRPIVRATPQERDNKGVIEGIVIDERRKPGADATVYAEPMGRPMAAVVPHAKTDGAGRFVIHIDPSWFGKFAVGAERLDNEWRRHTNPVSAGVRSNSTRGFKGY